MCANPLAQYTEFTAYAALLAGAPPTVLQRCLVAHHPHLWKIREHHLYGPDEPEPGAPDVWPVSPGNPLRAYIPNGSQVGENADGVHVKEPGRAEPVCYRSWASVQKAEEKPRGKLLDVFLTGEVSPTLRHAMRLVTDARVCPRVILRGVSSTSSGAYGLVTG